MKKLKVADKVKDILLSISGFAVVLLIWDTAVVYTSFGNLFPRPWTVLATLIRDFYAPIGKHTLLVHLGYSMRRVLIGYGLASVSGILLGILIGRSKLANAIIRPIYEIIRPIPSVAWIPMAIIWLGVGEGAKIFIIFMAAIASLVTNVYSGAQRVDNELIGVAYMLGASEWKGFFHVILPSCVPYIFNGLHSALGISWMAVLAAEMICASEGIGWIITMGQEEANMVQILVGIVVIALVGLLLSGFMQFLEGKLCSWRERGK